MSLEELLTQARDTMTVKRVYGEPIQHNGITIIPAAKVRGGGGGGSGENPERGKGWGGGFGVTAGPVGSYVIKGDAVRWVPAVDVNRAILIGGAVAIATLFALRPLLKAFANR